jgi:hypothetical protein
MIAGARRTGCAVTGKWKQIVRRGPRTNRGKLGCFGSPAAWRCKCGAVHEGLRGRLRVDRRQLAQCNVKNCTTARIARPGPPCTSGNETGSPSRCSWISTAASFRR